MQTSATTVEDYLASLSPERAEAMREVRAVILEHLPSGLEESINWGMIAYEVPLSVSGKTYNGQPLAHTALASQKNYMSLYLMSIYTDDDRAAAFETAYRATGKRYDVGKSCVRFRRVEDLPLELIGETIAACSVEDLVAVHAGMMSARAAKSKARRS